MTWNPASDLAESVPLLRVLDRLPIRQLGDRNTLAGDEEALGDEVHHDHQEASAFLADEVLRRHAAILERELGSVARPPTGLLELARHA